MPRFRSACLILCMAAAGCGQPEPVRPTILEPEKPASPWGFPGLEPGAVPPQHSIPYRPSSYETSREAIRKMTAEIMLLKDRHPELSDFTAQCISEGGLSLRYRKNVIEGDDGGELGSGDACEIVVEFSPAVDRGASPIAWGNYTIIYPRLKWQVCSYPACFWIASDHAGRSTQQFGGRFIRSHNIPLCRQVHAIVQRHLKAIERLEAEIEHPASR